MWGALGIRNGGEVPRAVSREGRARAGSGADGGPALRAGAGPGAPRLWARREWIRADAASVWRAAASTRIPTTTASSFSAPAPVGSWISPTTSVINAGASWAAAWPPRCISPISGRKVAAAAAAALVAVWIFSGGA